MDWQKLISLFIVLAAFLLLVRSEYKKYKLRKSRPCGSDCDCVVVKEFSAKRLK